MSIGRNRRLVWILISTARLLGPALTLDIVYEIQQGLGVVQALKRPDLFLPPRRRGSTSRPRGGRPASKLPLWLKRREVTGTILRIAPRDNFAGTVAPCFEPSPADDPVDQLHGWSYTYVQSESFRTIQ